MFFSRQVRDRGARCATNACTNGWADISNRSSRHQITLDDLGRDLRPGDHRSEMPLAIGTTPHFSRKKKSSFDCNCIFMLCVNHRR
ncbi:hypothetical protein J6590_008632 [Homalodisca vitripennis]|nr:hypothetical protein J6590_008632 [Homalodisca vitripennis]